MTSDFKIQAIGLNLHYGQFQALQDVGICIRPCTITAIIGPSGCGKSTLLRCFNRMNELIKGVRVTGRLLLDGADILAPKTSLPGLRRRVGMVFQRPNPFPLSIFDNVAYGPRVHGLAGRAGLHGIVEASLRATRLWDQVKDRLDAPALGLSPEQQQRLCISRLVAVEPEVLLMDEPCSALDPISTGHIEDLMRQLAEKYTIVIVTHNMQQAARVSSEAAFMLLGELVEFGSTTSIFENPQDKRTEEYVSGRYG
ncbi:MAG TPA: phosphate ABC transporter ATP-binding protein PstB [Phycisphaerae bacterium]|nr:phosphate ABC transporter ATP-binding protein PstB [Phycisphaerae bacterium]